MSRTSDEIKEKAKANEPLHTCSFCGKHQYEVKQIIAGPCVYICNECLALCNDIMIEMTNESPQASASEATANADEAIRAAERERLIRQITKLLEEYPGSSCQHVLDVLRVENWGEPKRDGADADHGVPDAKG